MSLHLTILLWLGIIFVIAASIILGLLLKSKKKNVKNLFRFYRNILYFWICFTHLRIHIWYIIA